MSKRTALYWVAGGTVTLAVMVMAVLHLALSVIINEDFIVDKVQDVLGSRPARVEDISYSYLPLSVSLTGLEIGNPEDISTEAGQSLLSLGRLQVEVNLWSVLTPGVPPVVNDFTIEKLHLRLWRNTQGRANWAPMPATDDKGIVSEDIPEEKAATDQIKMTDRQLQNIFESPPVIFNRIDISDISVSVDDYRDDRHINVEKARLSWSPAAGQGLSSGAVFAIADGISGEWEMRSDPVLTEGDSITLPGFSVTADIQSEHLPDGHGVINFAAEPVISSKGELNMDPWRFDLPHVQAEGGLQLSSDSTLIRLKLDVTDTLSTLRLLGFPAISSQALVQDGNTLSVRIPKIMMDMASGALEIRSLDINGLGMAINTELQGEHLMEVGAEKLYGSIQAEVSNVPALLQLYAYVQDAEDKLPGRLAGAYSSQASASGLKLMADFDLDRAQPGLSLQGQARIFDVDIMADVSRQGSSLSGEYRVAGGNIGRLLSVVMDNADGPISRLGSMDISGKIAGSIDQPMLQPLDVALDIIDRIDVPHRYQLSTRMEGDIPERRLTIKDLVISGLGLASRTDEIIIGHDQDGLFASGNLRVDKSSPRQFIDMLVAMPNSADPEALQHFDGGLEFNLIGGIGQFDLIARLDDTAIKAKAELTRKEDQPSLEFMLDTSRLDMDRYLSLTGDEKAAPAVAEPSPATAEAPLISDDLIELLHQTFLSGDWRAEEFIVRGVRLAGLHVQVNAPADGTLTVQAGSDAFYEGRMQTDLMVDGRVEPAAISAKVSMETVQLSPLLSDTVQMSRLQGELSAAGQVTASNGSLSQIKRTLNGAVNFNVSAGTYTGADLVKRISNITDITQLLGSDAGAGQTEFSSFQATIALTDGMAASEDLQILAPGLRVTGKGRYSIPDNSVDYKAVLHLSREGTEEGIPVAISGSPPKLRYAVDISSLAVKSLLPKLISGGKLGDLKSVQDTIKEKLLGSDQSKETGGKEDVKKEDVVKEGLKKLLKL